MNGSPNGSDDDDPDEFKAEFGYPGMCQCVFKKVQKLPTSDC